MTTRRERDLLGEKEIPEDSLYGIHTARALENFGAARRFVHPELVRAYGRVKLACAQVNRELGFLPDAIADPIERACMETAEGLHDDKIVVEALQGGAGTSTNMNVNEVIANRALELMGRAKGDYRTISPLDHANLHQSTNDTYPTALKLAAIVMIRRLDRELVSLHEAFQAKEKEFAPVVKVGRTQFQDAVLTTLGREMGAYAEAFARDRWRVYKCEERLRVVNLGGTAIGTGLAAPRRFIFRVVDKLREHAGVGLARAENLVECTQNADVFVEVSGILKACAVNLLKISSDLRFLSSGPDAGIGEINLPGQQAGSSIMPGKVNPVIPEYVSQCAITVMANDAAVAQACAIGSLELNPFLPLVAHHLLESIELLSEACGRFRALCVEGITANEDRCRAHVENSTASVTALVAAIGHEKATEIAKICREAGRGVKDVAVGEGYVTEEQFRQLTSPEAVCRLGF